MTVQSIRASITVQRCLFPKSLSFFRRKYDRNTCAPSITKDSVAFAYTIKANKRRLLSPFHNITFHKSCPSLSPFPHCTPFPSVDFVSQLASSSASFIISSTCCGIVKFQLIPPQKRNHTQKTTAWKRIVCLLFELVGVWICVAVFSPYIVRRHRT